MGYRISQNCNPLPFGLEDGVFRCRYDDFIDGLEVKCLKGISIPEQCNFVASNNIRGYLCQDGVKVVLHNCGSGILAVGGYMRSGFCYAENVRVEKARYCAGCISLVGWKDFYPMMWYDLKDVDSFVISSTAVPVTAVVSVRENADFKACMNESMPALVYDPYSGKLVRVGGTEVSGEVYGAYSFTNLRGWSA